MQKKVLITGISGFAGSYLAQHLLAVQSDIQITGTYLSEKSLENVSSIKDKLNLEKVNLTDLPAVSALIEKTRPDQVYHLAALTSTFTSLGDPASSLENNINAQLYLLESLREKNLLTARIVVVGSGMMYGRIKPTDLPLDEETPLQPITPYDVSKITQDFMGLQYFNAYSMPILRARPFNHAGPRLSDQFVISAFSKKIAEIEKGKREPVLSVGNLSTKRDITDVRDMVHAYALLMEKGIPGEAYNIGRGQSYRINDLLRTLLSFSQTKIDVRVDQNLVRPNEIPDMVCDAAKFIRLTGWKPEIPMEQTLKETLDYWREII